MRTYQHKAFTVLDRYDILYAGHKCDAGVGSGRRRRFYRLIWSLLLHKFLKVFLIEVRDSVVLSIVLTVMEFEGMGQFRLREARFG